MKTFLVVAVLAVFALAFNPSVGACGLLGGSSQNQNQGQNQNQLQNQNQGQNQGQAQGQVSVNSNENTNQNDNKNTNKNSNANNNTNLNCNSNKNTNMNSNKNTAVAGAASFSNSESKSKSKSKVDSTITITDNSIQEDRRETADIITGPNVDAKLLETKGDRPSLRRELSILFGALNTLSVDQLDSLGEFVECKGHAAYLVKRTFPKDDDFKVTFVGAAKGAPRAVITLDAKKKCSMLELIGVIGDYASQVKGSKAYIIDAGYKKIVGGSGFSINIGGGFSAVLDKATTGKSSVASSGIGYAEAESDEAWKPWAKILLMK